MFKKITLASKCRIET